MNPSFHHAVCHSSLPICKRKSFLPFLCFSSSTSQSGRHVTSRVLRSRVWLPSSLHLLEVMPTGSMHGSWNHTTHRTTPLTPTQTQTHTALGILDSTSTLRNSTMASKKRKQANAEAKAAEPEHSARDQQSPQNSSQENSRHASEQPSPEVRSTVDVALHFTPLLTSKLSRLQSQSPRRKPGS